MSSPIKPTIEIFNSVPFHDTQIPFPMAKVTNGPS